MLTKRTAFLPPTLAGPKRARRFQHFATPIALGFVAGTAAAITPSEVRLEALAGTGPSHPCPTRRGSLV